MIEGCVGFVGFYCFELCRLRCGYGLESFDGTTISRGIFEPSVEETDLARVALSCHFALDLL